MQHPTQSFPIRSNFPVNLKLLPDQNKFHRTVGGQWPILILRNPKKPQPLFYQTCPVGPTLLGWTDHTAVFPNNVGPTGHVW